MNKYRLIVGAAFVALLTPIGLRAGATASSVSSQNAVTSITGTSGQITASAATGDVTLSLPTALTGINSIIAASATDLVLNGGSSGVSMTLGNGVNGSATLTPKGTGVVGIAGGMQVTGSQNPSTGIGVEIVYDPTLKGVIQSYSRTGASYMPINIFGSSITLGGSGQNTTVAGNLTVSGTGPHTFGGTVRAGTGSGETLSAGSVDVQRDIGIVSGQGIVQGGVRIVTFTSGNTAVAGKFTAAAALALDNGQTLQNTSSAGYGPFFSGGSSVASTHYTARFVNYSQSAVPLTLYSDRADFSGITSTAANTTSGALVVGSNVGLSGNAGGASYFGGGVTATDYIIGTSGPSVQSSIAARAAAQGAVLDGATGMTVTSIGAAGANDFTLSAKLYRVAGSGGGVYGGTGSAGFNVDASGNVGIAKVGITGLGTFPGYQMPAGKWTHLAVVNNAATWTLLANGLVVSTLTPGAQTFASGTTIIGADSSISTTPWTGGITAIYPYNRALSAAEVLALYEQGVPAAADVHPQMQYAVSGKLNTSPFNIYSGTITASTNTATALVGTFTSQGYAWLVNTTIGNIPLVKNGSYLLTYTVNSTTAVTGFQISGNSGADAVFLPYTAGTHSVVVPSDTNGGTAWWFNVSSAGGAAAFDISAISFAPLGLLCYPDPQQPGDSLTWNDLSGNGAHIVLPTSGVTWNTPTAAPFHVRGTTSTNGNQQMLAAVCLPSNCQIVRIRARSRTGTPTITMGTASGGAQLVASVALSTTWQNLTIALTGGIVSSASSVWVGSNSTDVVETDIAAEPLSF